MSSYQFLTRLSSAIWCKFQNFEKKFAVFIVQILAAASVIKGLYLTANASGTTKYFYKKLLWNWIYHIFALLLTPFASRLVNLMVQSLWKKSLKTAKSLIFEENLGQFRILMKDLNLTRAGIIDRFERKMYQKKHEDVTYKALPYSHISTIYQLIWH